MFMSEKKEITLKDIQSIVRQFVIERDWGQFHNPKDMAISLNLEASEVLEHFQWKNEQEIADHIKNHGQEIGEELSDVLYWTLYLADRANIDLKQAFERKMQQNESKYPIDKAKGTHKKYTELNK